MVRIVSTPFVLEQANFVSLLRHEDVFRIVFIYLRIRIRQVSKQGVMSMLEVDWIL